MDTNPIDPELSAFAYSGADFPDANTATEGEPDAFSKLFEDAALAIHLGGDKLGHARVERLHEQTAGIDMRAEQIFKRDRTAPAPANDWDAPLTDNSHTLAKMESSLDRRKHNLSIWMRGELALGKSVRELIDHAEKHDRVAANLMREVAMELGEAA